MRAWLAPVDARSKRFVGSLSRFRREQMRAWEVSLLVNDPKTDDARVIAPVD